MQEQHVQVATPAGPMETCIVHPNGRGSFPAVILYQNVGGLSEMLCNMGRRVASMGYYCALPDLYHRLGKVVIDPDSHDEHVLAVRRAASGSMTHAQVIEDTAALLAFLDTEQAVQAGPMGCIGYCMGGRFVIVVAGTFPERFKATASLFGTRLITDDEDSAHHYVSKMRGEVYCGFAEHDPSAPLPMVEEFTKLLERCAVTSLAEVHPGTLHGYAFPGRTVYHKAASERSWARIAAMFERQLPTQR